MTNRHRSQLEIAYDYSGRALTNLIAVSRSGLDRHTASPEQLDQMRLTKTNLISSLQHVETMLGERWEKRP